MKLKMLGVLLLCLSVSACDPDREILQTIDAGTVISSSPLSTSFNEEPISNITTTKASFVVFGYHSVYKGKKAWVNVYKNKSYLCIDGNERCWYIYK